MRGWFGRGFRREGEGSPAERIERPGYTVGAFGVARDRSDEGVYVEVRPSGVRAILDEWRRVGGEHSGLSFWAPGVILIRELATFERIVALIEDLMAEEELELVFVPLEHDRQTP